jgi:tetratricopeptide (TPR) repeat protein
VSEHFDQLELNGFLHGRLARPQARSVVVHLLLCQECRTKAAPHLSSLLSGRIPSVVQEMSSELDSAYDAAIERAFARVLDLRRRLREKSGVKRALAVYDEKGLSGLREEPRLLHGLISLRTLLEICQELRYEDPKRMVDAATLAVYVADRLNPKRHGLKRLADWRCRALLELANAHRVADCLDDAEHALGDAVCAFEKGNRGELLQARLCDVRASLLADRRLFADASEALESVYAIYCRRGDRHLAGRALISKGIYVGYAGAPEEAIQLLREGLSLIDADRDPSLVYGAVHNQAHFLLTCGRLREARSLLWKSPLTPEGVGGRVNLLKIQWLAAQVDADLGDLVRAEEGFRNVKRGFEEAGLYYKAALVSLEMATVWMRQGRPDEARALVVEALGVFTVLRIQREALGSLLLLDRAFEERAATGAMVEAVIELLKRAEDAAAPFAATPL